MSVARVTIRNTLTGEVQISFAEEGFLPPGMGADWEVLQIETPAEEAMAARGYSFAGGAWVPAPPELMPDEIFALYTPAEQIAICGSAIPEVRTLVSRLGMQRAPLSVASSWHQQGTALLQGLGLLTAARAARVLAGLPPE